MPCTAPETCRGASAATATAAVNNLSDDREFNPRYQEILTRYGLQGHRINVRKPHECQVLI